MGNILMEPRNRSLQQAGGWLILAMAVAGFAWLLIVVFQAFLG